MSVRIDPSLAATVMPLRIPSPVPRNWTSMGLPGSGWVMIREQAICANHCPDGPDACVMACTADHGLPSEGRQAMGTCAQCDPAPCAEACPTEAITRSAQGIIQIDQELCIGCRFCEDQCENGALLFVDPYQTASPDYPLPDYSPGQPTGLLANTVAKCTFCSDRLLSGEMPVCSTACPAHAIWVANLDRDTATNGRRLARLSELLAQHSFEAMRPGHRVLLLG